MSTYLPIYFFINGSVPLNVLHVENGRCWYDHHKYLLSCRVISIWNSLPSDIVTTPSINSFINRLDKLWSNRDSKQLACWTIWRRKQKFKLFLIWNICFFCTDYCNVWCRLSSHLLISTLWVPVFLCIYRMDTSTESSVKVAVRFVLCWALI